MTPRNWDAAEWTRDNYRAALAAIAASEHGAVRCSVLDTMPLAGGERATSSMVENNVLLYRTYYKTARDVPEEAFGKPGMPKEPVYMLPSAAHLVVAKAMLASGELEAAKPFWKFWP